MGIPPSQRSLKVQVQGVMVSNAGKPMLPTWILEMLKRRGQRAGIPNLHPHRFRHRFAMTALEGEMPERLLRLSGGWKKISDNYFRTLGAIHIGQYHQDFSPADRLGNILNTRKPRGGTGKSTGRGRL